MQSIEQLLKELLDSVVTLRSNAEADVLRREATQKALTSLYFENYKNSHKNHFS